MVFLTAGFAQVFPEKRLDLNRPEGCTKAEELWPPEPQLLSLRPPLGAI